MTDKKYEYFDIATGIYRSDGTKTEKYMGSGVWKEILLNPYERMDIHSDKYDFGQTSEILTDEDVRIALESEDYLLSLKKKRKERIKIHICE